MKKVTITAALAAVALMFTDCKPLRLLDFTVISSKNVTLRLPDDAKGPRTKGEDLVFCFGMPTIKAATDKAIENAGPGYDALIDGVLYQKTYGFKTGYIVEGTPIKTSKLKASN